MQKVRRWLTEILLDVTNEETESVAREVLTREKRKKAKGSMTCLLHTSHKLFPTTCVHFNCNIVLIEGNYNICVLSRTSLY